MFYARLSQNSRTFAAMNLKELENKRIAVLLSGGVDSSVVVYEFARLGLHPDCFYIKIGPEEDEEWDCSSEEDLEMATAVSRKYGCRLEVVDCHREYWDQVTTYTMDKVRAGLTPNPDVMCNRLIKFGAFDAKCGHDYDLIATGHYAQTETDADGSKWLCTSPDPVKDQTDFLAQIYDWQLRKALFPIGHYMKDEVREIAEREHLVNARRKDSQGICFLGKINYNDYIRRFLGEQPGDVIELETGRRIGTHKGLWFHTIGQRKGMRLQGARFPFPHPAAAARRGHLQDPPHARVSSRPSGVDGLGRAHRPFPGEDPRCRPRPVLRRLRPPPSPLPRLRRNHPIKDRQSNKNYYLCHPNMHDL